MRFKGRRKSTVFFIVLGACLVGLAVALNVSWVVLNWREVALLVVGIIFFIAIIAGLILNTIFLVREIRRNEQHDAFINAVTHELKTPIASIKLYLETLKSRDVEPERRREFYDIMLNDSDRLLHTVEEVLLAGQLANRRFDQEATRIDLRDAVRECLDLAKKRYPQLPADAFGLVESLDDGDVPAVKANPDELRTVISNLIDNAVKYSTEKVKVTVELASSGNRLLVRVKDQGVGIPRTQLKRIFRRFYRVPGRIAMTVKGTGLGLFIVHAIVRKLGGRVTAESPGEGLGATITMQLPRA